MKLSVVFLIVFAALVVDLQAQTYNIRDNFFKPDRDDDNDDRDSSKLPIPIITDQAAAAIVQGSNMLADALKAAIAEEVFDKTGVLTIVRSLLTEINNMLNNLFTKVSGAVAITITRSREPESSLSDLISEVKEAADEIHRIIDDLRKYVKPSELSDVSNALNDIVKRVLNLDILKPKSRSPYNPFLFDDFGFNRNKDKDAYNYQGLDLQTVISDWSTAIEGIAKAVQVLAKAIQKVISTRSLTISVQKSIYKSLSISGSFLSSVSTKLNSALESANTKLTMYGQMILTQVNQSYSSITSNPNKWHHRLLSKLYDFLASYSDYVHRDYLHPTSASMKKAEIDIASEFIRATRKSGLKISKVATYITDRAAASANPRASSTCSMSQITILMGPTNSLTRLAQCISVESSNIHGISGQAQQLVTVAKDNAANVGNQLSVCNSGTDECYRQFSQVFDGKKERSKKDLETAADQVESMMRGITERITNCLKSVADEIESTCRKCEKDFDFCLRF
ncbi:AAEL001067-PA [Aedes aegypti]|uniref:AAEL001067-PA n=1 Tax=Aedes aegypti TaxID=7159 RepID=Q17MB4_AEDAE|nr:AAEL001067-PA [Aedes aegypti]